jgi:hypothetical protein
MSEQFDFNATYQQLKQLHDDKELSPHEAKIFDFVSVIKEQPDLLTAEYRASLENLLEKVSDDVNEISNQITVWYKNCPLIKKAIFERPTYSNERGAGGRKTKLTDKEFKQLIENVVRDSKPPKK